MKGLIAQWDKFMLAGWFFSSSTKQDYKFWGTATLKKAHKKTGNNLTFQGKEIDHF